jgi:hypothetical protein
MVAASCLLLVVACPELGLNSCGDRISIVMRGGIQRRFLDMFVNLFVIKGSFLLASATVPAL